MTIKTKPRGHVQVNNMKDELSYQVDKTPNVLPVQSIEQLKGLCYTFIIEVVDGHIEPVLENVEDLDLSDEDDEQNDNNNEEDLDFDNNDK